MTRNFTASVKEPLGSDGQPGLAILFEFHEATPGFSGDVVWLRLKPGTSMAQAKDLSRHLKELGEMISFD